MDIVPYTFRQAHFKSDTYRGYWVTVFCIFDGISVYSFFHESDLTDNRLLMSDCGVDFECFKREILVTPDRFSRIFDRIEDYVQKSSFSG